MIKQKTHLSIDRRLVGIVEEIGEATSCVRLLTTNEMAADDRGLVHGGFTFGLADYAAMVAVNDANVVLGSTDVRFLAPVRAGQEMVASARIIETKGKKRAVSVRVEVDGKPVIEGSFTTFILDHHVLDI
jgi:acyl-coenzyme A thioesterase PaaI-like protein